MWYIVRQECYLILLEGGGPPGLGPGGWFLGPPLFPHLEAGAPLAADVLRERISNLVVF